MNLSAFVRGLPAAVIFLTRIPVPGSYTSDDFRNASGYFALIGLAVGGVGALVVEGTGLLGSTVAACLAVTATILITGAMHEDGLADTADALFGARERDRVFAILKDPRLGSFGVITLVMVSLTRVACVAKAESAAIAAIGFLIANVVSRFTATVALARLPYVTPEDQAKSTDVVRAGAGQVLGGAVTVVALTLVALALHAIDLRTLGFVVVFASVAVASVLAWFSRRLAGVTGDLVGALVQLVDLSIWLALVASRA